jgi:hypothetical protein
MNSITPRNQYQANYDAAWAEIDARNAERARVAVRLLTIMREVVSVSTEKQCLEHAQDAVRRLWLHSEDQNTDLVTSTRKAMDVLDEAPENIAGVRGAIDAALEEIRHLST